jgi:phospholipid/cholesterol/gamma-HCH transport system substrate-binding protein
MAVKREIKVGIFVIVGLIVAGVLIFLVGDERRVFDKHFTLNADFDDVAGLKPGAPVRMGGIDVGSVQSVSFGDNAADRKLHVRISVVSGAHERIREDSIVTIANKGLLGDKMLEITQGGEGKPIIPDNGKIKSQPPDDLQKYLTKANEILDLAKSTLKNLETVTGTAADKDLQADLKASVSSIRRLLGDAAANDGFVHRLLTDKQMADHLDSVFVEAARAGRSFDRIAVDVRYLLRQVKEGPGLAHTLLYSKDGDKTLASFAKTADELAKTMEEIRTGKGAIHELVYGESGQEVTVNLQKMSADLRDIVADIKAGKGTIGALMVDPSVYEDVKSILGNIDRNQVLRALVRYTIKQDEDRPSISTSPPPKGSTVTNPEKVPPLPPKTEK